MEKLSIKDFDRFMRGPFRDRVEKAFEKHQIFCEADLQSFAWRWIKSFLERHEERRGKFRVLNKPFLRDCKTYPDLVVFRKRVPWVVIELKESRLLTKRSASSEHRKLLRARKILGAKRGYLVYVARRGEEQALLGPKGKGARYFFEVPIVLAGTMDRDKLAEWVAAFRSWSKYTLARA